MDTPTGKSVTVTFLDGSSAHFTNSGNEGQYVGLEHPTPETLHVVRYTWQEEPQAGWQSEILGEFEEATVKDIVQTF